MCLAPNASIWLGGRADEGESGILDGPGEAGVLGQEPVAGMDGRAEPQRRLQDGVGSQVAVPGRAGPEPYRVVGLPDVRRGAVGVGVHRYGAQTQARALRMTRRAISPRLAIRTLSKRGAHAVVRPPARTAP